LTSRPALRHSPVGVNPYEQKFGEVRENLVAELEVLDPATSAPRISTVIHQLQALKLLKQAFDQPEEKSLTWAEVVALNHTREEK